MHKSRNKIQKYWVADVALRQNNNTSIQPTGTKMATESTVVARNLAYNSYWWSGICYRSSFSLFLFCMVFMTLLSPLI